jgi:hypothetical protein
MATLIAWDGGASDASQFFAAMSAALEGAEGFERVNTGPDIGVRVFQGPGGVLALGNLATPEYGNVTVITAAPDQAKAMELLLAAVG